MSATIAIQGNAGSFHDQAARQYTGSDYHMLACDTFREVFAAVKDGKADFGVVAIENSLHGSINPVYRLLSEHGLWVCGEERLHIELYLIGTTNIAISNITQVMSQAEALSQCELWINENLSHVVIQESNDTAGSVKTIIEQADLTKTAVASKAAAALYDATVLAGPINDDPENYTRFFILTKKPIEIPDANRTSIIMTERDHDTAGTLHDALGIFKEYAINLSKLDSHTLTGKYRRYAFYVDFDENYYSEKGKNAIEKIRKLGWDIAVLGTYKKSEH